LSEPPGWIIGAKNGFRVQKLQLDGNDCDLGEVPGVSEMEPGCALVPSTSWTDRSWQAKKAKHQKSKYPRIMVPTTFSATILPCHTAEVFLSKTSKTVWSAKAI